jgi:hypothetical protein
VKCEREFAFFGCLDRAGAFPAIGPFAGLVGHDKLRVIHARRGPDDSGQGHRARSVTQFEDNSGGISRRPAEIREHSRDTKAVSGIEGIGGHYRMRVAGKGVLTYRNNRGSKTNHLCAAVSSSGQRDYCFGDTFLCFSLQSSGAIETSTCGTALLTRTDPVNNNVVLTDELLILTHTDPGTTGICSGIFAQKASSHCHI